MELIELQKIMRPDQELCVYNDDDPNGYIGSLTRVSKLNKSNLKNKQITLIMVEGEDIISINVGSKPKVFE